MKKSSSLPGSLPAHVAASKVTTTRFIGAEAAVNLAALTTTPNDFVQPTFYPDSLPYQISAIPEGGASPSNPEDPGTVLGVPPDAGVAESPTYNLLSAYLTRPLSVVYVGEPLDSSITPSGTATAPYAEISDAMDDIETQPNGIYEIVVAPGAYADFAIPAAKVVIIRGPSLAITAITVESGGLLSFADVEIFQVAPSITFSVPDSANTIFFDSTSARAFGFQASLQDGTITNGTPVTRGAGPYLAFATTAFNAFASAYASSQYSVSVANGTTDAQTVGVVYPAVVVAGSGHMALVWPSGTLIPSQSGLAAGPLYRAANGNATATPTTQQIGVDDGARVYVDLSSVAPSSSTPAVILGGVDAMLSTYYLGLSGKTSNLATGVPGDVRGAARSLSKITFGINAENANVGAVTAQLYLSADEGATFAAIAGSTASIAVGSRTASATFGPTLIPALGRVVALINTGVFSYSVSVTAE